MALYLTSILGDKVLDLRLDHPTTGDLPSPNVRTILGKYWQKACHRGIGLNHLSPTEDSLELCASQTNSFPFKHDLCQFLVCLTIWFYSNSSSQNIAEQQPILSMWWVGWKAFLLEWMLCGLPHLGASCISHLKCLARKYFNWIAAWLVTLKASSRNVSFVRWRVKKTKSSDHIHS